MIEAEVCSEERLEVPQHQIKVTAWSWKEFMEYPLTPALANEHTVKFFTQQCSAEFTKRWCQPLCKSPKTYESVGDAHPICSEPTLRSSGSPRCWIRRVHMALRYRAIIAVGEDSNTTRTAQSDSARA